MKIIVQLVLWVVIGLLGYKVYDSIYSSVRFQEIKQDRFAVAITQLKNIRTAQLAHKTVTGKFANNYEKLAQFIDTAKFEITQQRDSSFSRFNKAIGVSQSIDTVVTDILGYESVKDSLFKSIDYKNLEKVVIDNKEVKIDLKTSAIEKNSILYPVFKAEVSKRDLLFDQQESYLSQEDQVQSVEEINGTTISVGDLNEINTNGNWPIVYDK